jgi:hypothetical protein
MLPKEESKLPKMMDRLQKLKLFFLLKLMLNKKHLEVKVLLI